MKFLPKDILQYGTYGFVMQAMIGIFIFSAFYAKQYLGTIVSGMVGLVLGRVGGYGIGKNKSSKKTNKHHFYFFCDLSPCNINKVTILWFNPFNSISKSLPILTIFL